MHSRTERDISEIDDPETFERKKHEFAAALVAKAKDIDNLADALTGLKRTKEQQIERIKELEIALSEVEVRRTSAIDGRREVQRELDSIIAKTSLAMRAAN